MNNRAAVNSVARMVGARALSVVLAVELSITFSLAAFAQSPQKLALEHNSLPVPSTFSRPASILFSDGMPTIASTPASITLPESVGRSRLPFAPDLVPDAMSTGTVSDVPGYQSIILRDDSVSTQTMSSASAAIDKPQETLAFGLTPGGILPTPVMVVPVKTVPVQADEPITIDNDEATQIKETIKYIDPTTDEGKTQIVTGAKFPIVVSSEISSKTAKVGDPFQARLKYDLKIGDKMIAKQGDMVYGHINYVLKARTQMAAMFSTKRFYRNSGVLGITFDEIINGKGEHLPLVATPAQQARIVKNKAEGRILGVNHLGQVTGPWSQQLQYKAIRIGINAAMAPAGVFSFGAMPCILGMIGAANPSFAFTKPVGLNVRHRRLKGFAVGFLSGVPGSWIIEDSLIHGQESIIMPGDEFLAEFKQSFTGEPATEAQLIPGASAKVHGQVIPEKNSKKKNN